MLSIYFHFCAFCMTMDYCKGKIRKDTIQSIFSKWHCTEVIKQLPYIVTNHIHSTKFLTLPCTAGVQFWTAKGGDIPALASVCLLICTDVVSLSALHISGSSCSHLQRKSSSGWLVLVKGPFVNVMSPKTKGSDANSQWTPDQEFPSEECKTELNKANVLLHNQTKGNFLVWRNNTANRALVWHMTYPGLIPGTPEVPPPPMCTARSALWVQKQD